MKFINDLGYDIKIQIPPLGSNLKVRNKILKPTEIIEISDSEVDYIYKYKDIGLRELSPRENIEFKIL